MDACALIQELQQINMKAHKKEECLSVSELTISRAARCDDVHGAEACWLHVESGVLRRLGLGPTGIRSSGSTSQELELLIPCMHEFACRHQALSKVIEGNRSAYHLSNMQVVLLCRPHQGCAALFICPIEHGLLGGWV
jgi:hypothetical protein